MTDLATLITNQARRTGADPLTMLATAIVESGLNPGAVGDGGSSFGLYQMHIGGAGGATRQSAMRYLDPMAAVENRARAFRGGSGGAFAASVQRPADPAGYARKVDAVIAQLKAGKMPSGIKGQLNAPVASRGVTGASEGMSGGKAAALSLIFGDDPVFASMIAAHGEGSKPSFTTPSAGGKGGVPERRKGEPGWAYLQRVARAKFGLRNDPGDSQTTGGHHTAGSNHYRGTAIDFGNGRNDPAKLRQWDQYVEANKAALGVGEHIAIGSRPDHMDHSHTATLRAIRGGTKKQKGRFA